MSMFRAAADLQKLANMFSVLQETADAVKKLAQLEQYEAEIKVQATEFERTIRDAKAKLDAEKASIDSIRETASAQAESLLMQAKAECDLMLAQAKDQAKTLLADAQQVLDDATETKEEAAKKLAEAKEEVVQINNEVGSLERRAQAAKEYLAKLAVS